MPSIVVETPEGVALGQELAGPGSRSAAALLDGVVYLTAVLTAGLLVVFVAGVDPTGVAGFAQGVLLGGLPLVYVGYAVLFGAVSNGQTPGKRALGLRVTGDDGYPVTVRALVLRSLLLPIDLLPLPVSIGLVLIGTSPLRQRLGDRVAGTLVVRESSRDADFEPFADERWEGLADRRLALVPALAARLDEADYEFLRALLARGELEYHERRALFVDAARHYSALLDLGPFDDARVVLKELYLYLRHRRGAGPEDDSGDGTVREADRPGRRAALRDS